MEKKLYIFDMDGTILNTIDDIAAAVNFILGKYDMPLHTVDEVKFFVGNGLLKTLERSVPDGTPAEFVEKIYPEFTAYYKSHSDIKTGPYEGMVDVIRELKKRGRKLAVVSNKRQEAVLDLCEVFFKDCFDIALGDCEGIKIKPAPDMVEKVLETLGEDKASAVYIGDSDVDLLTAKNSGLDCIAVAWGFRGREFLETHGATNIIDNPKDLLD